MTRKNIIVFLEERDEITRQVSEGSLEVWSLCRHVKYLNAGMIKWYLLLVLINLNQLSKDSDKH